MLPIVIAVDTNVWVSTFITPHGYSARLKQHWRANRFNVVISTELLAELAVEIERHS